MVFIGKPLEPNTDARCTLWFRALHSGPERTVRILLKYRAAIDDKNNSKLNHTKHKWRYLEYSFSVAVTTTVSCKPTVRSLSTNLKCADENVDKFRNETDLNNKKTSYLLSLLTTNRGEETIVLDTLQFASKSWQCHHLHRDNTNNEDNTKLPKNRRNNRVNVEPRTESVCHLILSPTASTPIAKTLNEGESTQSSGVANTARPVFDHTLDEESEAGVLLSLLHANNAGQFRGKCLILMTLYLCA